MSRSAVILKSNPYGLIVSLDPDLPFSDIQRAVAEKFRESAGFFKNAKLAVTFRGRELTKEEENVLLGEITGNSRIQVVCIVDEQEKSQEYYREAVEQALENQKKEDGQFYRGTLKSGDKIETEHSVVIIGDVNPGARVVSDGNIVILGCCMGDIFAGASGDATRFAAALTMKPREVRIADKAARSAITKKTDSGEYPVDPKMIYIKDGHLQVKPITSENLCEYLA